jgi:hypothetical protein
MYWKYDTGAEVEVLDVEAEVACAVLGIGDDTVDV